MVSAGCLSDGDVVVSLGRCLRPTKQTGAAQYRWTERHGEEDWMCGKSNCSDNSAVESFFKPLKAELVWLANGKSGVRP